MIVLRFSHLLILIISLFTYEQIDASLSYSQTIYYLQKRLHRLCAEKSMNIPLLAKIIGPATFTKLDTILEHACSERDQDNRSYVTMLDCYDAVDTLLFGPKVHPVLIPFVIPYREKLKIAYHEAGHAVMAAAGQQRLIIHKATIQPRYKLNQNEITCGFIRFIDSAVDEVLTEEDLMRRLVIDFSGVVAEQLCSEKKIFPFRSVADFRKGFANAISRDCMQKDLVSAREQVTALAVMRCARTGSCMNSDGSLDYTRFQEEKQAILANGYIQTVNLMKPRVSSVRSLAQLLCQKTTIYRKELYPAIGLSIPKYDFEM